MSSEPQHDEADYRLDSAGPGEADKNCDSTGIDQQLGSAKSTRVGSAEQQ